MFFYNSQQIHDCVTVMVTIATLIINTYNKEKETHMVVNEPQNEKMYLLTRVPSADLTQPAHSHNRLLQKCVQ